MKDKTSGCWPIASVRMFCKILTTGNFLSAGLYSSAQVGRQFHNVSTGLDLILFLAELDPGSIDTNFRCRFYTHHNGQQNEISITSHRKYIMANYENQKHDSEYSSKIKWFILLLRTQISIDRTSRLYCLLKTF